MTYKRKLRKKKAIVWDKMKEVILDNSTKKVQHNHYKELFAKNMSGTITQYGYHLKNYLEKKAETRGAKQTKQ